MPTFQVDPRRSVAVGTHPPAGAPVGGAGPDRRDETVAGHLDRLLGEHLLPLRIRESGQDEPYLLAVDATGQAVVVEVVGLLDEAAVLRALRYAGRASNLGEDDLARAYRGGPERFAIDLASFRATVPTTTLLSTGGPSGVRLLLVCTHVAEGVEDVVDFLLESASQVQIMRVGVVGGPDGTRIIDVSPFVRRPPSRRSPGPSPHESGARPASRHRSETGAETPRVPTVTPPPFAVRATAVAPTAPGGAAASGGGQVTGKGAGPFTARPTWTPTSTPPAAPEQTPFSGVPTARQPAVARRSAPARNTAGARQPAAARNAAGARQPAPARNSEVAREPAPAREQEPSGLDLAAELAGGHRFGPVEPTGHLLPTALPYAFTGVAPGPGPDERLVALAGAVGAPVALVWPRQRRGELFEALLHADGLIELPDGSVCLTPDEAASLVSGAEAVDGWRLWRIERPTGPTLAEALDR